MCLKSTPLKGLSALMRSCVTKSMALTGLIIYKAQRSEAEVISQKTTFDRLGSENNNLF